MTIKLTFETASLFYCIEIKEKIVKKGNEQQALLL